MAPYAQGPQILRVVAAAVTLLNDMVYLKSARTAAPDAPPAVAVQGGESQPTRQAPVLVPSHGTGRLRETVPFWWSSGPSGHPPPPPEWRLPPRRPSP